MLAPESNFLYVHIPKCGGTSLERSFADAGVRLTGIDGKRFDARCAHWPARSWRGGLGLEGWHSLRTFAVVRHPGALLVSLYHYQRDVVRPTDHNWIPSSVSFEQWMREHVARAEPGMWQELDAQRWWLDDAAGNVLVDRVYDLDALALHWPLLLEWLGLPATVKLRRDNATVHAPWADYYRDQPDLIKIVRRRYAADFARYGSSFGWTFDASGGNVRQIRTN